MKKVFSTLALSALLGTVAVAQADDLKISMDLVDEKGTTEAIGEVTVTKTDYGLVFTPDLKNLEPGFHGFHVHEEGSCEPAEDDDGKVVPAGAAKGHWDPEDTDKHGTPWGDGHLGDLPSLYVNEEGEATSPVLAPRLDSLDDLSDHALMIHVGGDNFSDKPEALGGGGARMACGVIK